MEYMSLTSLQPKQHQLLHFPWIVKLIASSPYFWCTPVRKKMIVKEFIHMVKLQKIDNTPK